MHQIIAYWLADTKELKAEEKAAPEGFRPGDLVIARVYNALENPRSRGKARPIVLVEENCGHWSFAGLTTKAHRRDGSLRQAVPNPLAVGLRKPGYLWGNRLHNVCKLDIDFCIGEASLEFARLIVATHPMSSAARDAILIGARQAGSAPRPNKSRSLTPAPDPMGPYAGGTCSATST